MLVFITLAVYWPAVLYSFINYDDTDYVTLNTPIQHGVNRDMLAWAFRTYHASNWHPVTWISHALDCSLYGPNAGGHHLTNLLFHAANTLLLFLLLEQMTGAMWRSGLVAALFAWHPLHVESVAWISERKDVLSTFFWMLTLLSYAFYAKRTQIRDIRSKIFYCLALFCFALGLMSKPMLVTLPFVLFLMDVWPLKRLAGNSEKTSTSPKLIMEKIPFFMLALVDCVATFLAQKGDNAVVSMAALPLSMRLSNALVSYVLYLWKTFCPANLALPYPYSHEWTFMQTAGAAILLAIITFIVIRQARAQPWLFVGWFWFVGTLVPVIGLMQVGLQSMADRYTYVPLIGIFMMIVWQIPEAWVRWPGPGLIFAAITTGILVFLVTGTETQLQYWRNSVTLFSHTVEVTQDNILAEYDLGEALARNGDDQHAIEHYQKALAIKPNRAEAQYNSQPQARFNLGLIYRAQKKWPEAERQFRAFLRDDPSSTRGHANLGVALVAENHVQEGVEEFRHATLVALNQPDDLQVLAMLDTAYAEAGRLSEAVSAAQNTRSAALAAGRKDLADAADKRISFYQEQAKKK